MDQERFLRDIEEYIERSSEVTKEFKGMANTIKEIAVAMDTARENGSNIYIMGNGGSASTASHIANDLNKSAIPDPMKRFKVICLNDNVPVMMAWANDVSYDVVFVEQLKNFLTKGDIVIGLSGSGNSPNVIKAIEYANEHGNTTIGITGAMNPNGGKLGKMAKIALIIPDSSMGRIEDFHLMLNHSILWAFVHNYKK